MGSQLLESSDWVEEAQVVGSVCDEFHAHDIPVPMGIERAEIH
jgi:hypothetical protein